MPSVSSASCHPSKLTPCKRKKDEEDDAGVDESFFGGAEGDKSNSSSSSNSRKTKRGRTICTHSSQSVPGAIKQDSNITTALTTDLGEDRSAGNQPFFFRNAFTKSEKPENESSSGASSSETAQLASLSTGKVVDKMPFKSCHNRAFATNTEKKTTPPSQIQIISNETYPPAKGRRRSLSQTLGIDDLHDLQVIANQAVREQLSDLDDVECVFRKASLYTVVAWIFLLVVTYTTYYALDFHLESEPPNVAPPDDTHERYVAQTAFFILLIGNILQVTPLWITPTHTTTPQDKKYKQIRHRVPLSGIIVAAIVIQGVSLATNALLAWGPNVVVRDQITGSRVFLIRWCEWIPLSGLITLVAESVDVGTKPGAWRDPIAFALMQFVSTLCGVILPCCQTKTQWMAVMTVSFATFLTIFPRVQIRWNVYRNTCKGRSVLEREYYDRRRFAYHVMFMCSIFWSILVTLYLVNLIIHLTMPADHWSASLTMTCDTVADVLAKVVYTRIMMDAYQCIFDSDLRSLKQLNELRELMAMLWVSSADVIVISTERNKSRCVTMFSPVFLTLIGANYPVEDTSPQDGDSASVTSSPDQMKVPYTAALVLETEHGKAKAAYYVDTAIMSGDILLQRLDNVDFVIAHEDLDHNAVLQALRIANTVRTTCNSDEGTKEAAPLRAMTIVHCNEACSEKIHCEMKVSKHSEATMVAVVRDVTERYKRFEAETRAHAETIARQRDMHTANRFTRHEVKNGLLSGIELCRILGQSLDEAKAMLMHNGELTDDGYNHVKQVLKKSSNCLNEKAMKSVVDLDGTLRDVLNTVLAEVMAREVVHEVYQPQLEELDVPAMLVSSLGMSKDRIPVEVKNGSMPKLMLDAQLIGHIHRNAVSNACKYGKQGGKVRTTVEFDRRKQEFCMEVLNEPGDGHSTLIGLGKSASEFVFAQGVRLQPHMIGKTEKKMDSSGDGAWIMQKCAKTMNGICNIYFSKELTRFVFKCPALSATQSNQPDYKEFVVPKDVWGIGVDDSHIQRKLLSRILEHAGVDPSRQIVLGESHEDILEFESSLMHLMVEHPESKFLVIVDEHLDYDNMSRKTHNGIHSGSLIMKQVLENLPKDHISRLLILMRSANDSAVDIALYTSRTHGYFPKAIMQRDRTREILAPLWLKRFPDDAPSGLFQNASKS